MAKTFRKSDGYIRSLVEEVMRLYHPDLVEYKISIDLIDAYDSKGEAAVMHHGLPAYAVIRTIPLKDRVMGRGDVEITFDANRVARMSERQKRALIDHELTHLEFKLNKDGEKTVDDIGRYLFKMKPHDREFGWFESVAMRWGKDSIESVQAREMVNDEYFQRYFLLEGLTDKEALGTEASLHDEPAPVEQPKICGPADVTNGDVIVVSVLEKPDVPNANNNIYTPEEIGNLISGRGTFQHDEQVLNTPLPAGPDVVEESMTYIPIDSPQFLKPPNENNS